MPELLERLRQALADRYAIERELGAARHLHPYILPLLDSAETAGLFFISLANLRW